MAALLACGDGAVLSHRSAANLWGLRPTDRTRVDVTTARAAKRCRPGIEAHRSLRLMADDVTALRGIPTTTVPRTLLDLADVVDRRALARAVERADALRLFDGAAMRAVLDRACGRRGAADLLRVLDSYDPASEFTRSELEHRFLALCRAAGIPDPKVNLMVDLPDGPIEADFAWPEARLIVETDGHRTHGTRGAFERDRRRDQRLNCAGWRVLRFTWHQVGGNPEQVASTLQALLERGPD